MVVLEVNASDADQTVIDLGLTRSWIFNGVAVGRTIEETREWDSLEVVIRYGEDQQGLVDTLVKSSGKVEVLNNDGGGFRGVDLSGESNQLRVDAPTPRSEVRPVDSWLLDDYSRESINRDGTVFELTLGLVPDREKAFDNQYGTFGTEPSETVGANDWNFDFTYGNFTTRRVSADASGSSDGSNKIVEINLILTPEQVRLFEENISYLNLARLRDVPDAQDVVDDTSSDSRNTIVISTPNNDGEPIPDGSYMVRDWETEWVGEAYQVMWEVVRV